MSVVCLKTSSLEEAIRNGEHQEAAYQDLEAPPRQGGSSNAKAVSTDELALLAKLEEANR